MEGEAFWSQIVNKKYESLAGGWCIKGSWSFWGESLEKH